MNQARYSRLFSFLWNIAYDVLVHAFEKGKYKDIILPLIVLRRFDAALAELRAEINYLNEYKQRLIADVVSGQINVQNN